MDVFITDLYALAEHCGYGTLHDEMIRDRIVVGLRDAALSEKLQLDAELTLDKAVTRVHHAEEVKKQQSLLRGCGAKKATQETPIGTIHKGFKPKAGQQECSWCGNSPSHNRQRCPA